jgi:ketosteroid isomerase-like protein
MMAHRGLGWIVFSVWTASVGCAGLTRAPVEAHLAARVAVEAVIDAQYAAVERGELDAWAKPLAPEAVLFGTDADELFFGAETIRARVVENASARMRPEVQRRYRSTGERQVRLSPDARAAWVLDDIDYVLTSSAGERRTTFRMTAILGERAGRWSIYAAHYANPLDDARAFAVTTWPAPQRSGDVRVGPEADTLAALVAPSDHFAGTLDESGDVILVGTAPDERILGGPAARRFVGAAEPRPGLTITPDGPPAAGLLPSGDAGWIAYTATLTLTRGGVRHVLPVRVTAGLLEVSGGTWRKVVEHVSVPALP